jgi:thiol-disulfide isomerase/thioredoxin
MNTRLLLITISTLFTITSYGTEEVKLHGKITHPISDSISVSFYETWVGYTPQKIATRLAGDGTFLLSFPLKYKYSIVTIQHGEQATEIAPVAGDDLYLTCDASNFDSTLHYSGKGADIANFIAAHMVARSFLNTFGSRMQSASAYAPDSFMARTNKSIQIEQDFLNAHGAALPESFKKFWMANFRYEQYCAMLDYSFFHEMMKQHSYTISKFEHGDFVLVKDVPPAFDDTYLNIQSYRQFIGSYYYQQLAAAKRLQGLDPGDNDSAVASLSMKNLPHGSAEVVAATSIDHGVKTDGYQQLHNKLVAFEKAYPKSEFLSRLKEEVTFKKSISAGSPAMDFTIHTIDGKTVSLSSLKGKVVYLDFWASWCGPCLGEMPFAKKIEEKYKDKDVVFLYVSIDADDAAWKKKLDELKQEGMHMRDEIGGWDGPVAKEYHIQSVPSYFLIDKQGNYALDTTPRPSDATGLATAIDKLLN